MNKLYQKSFFCFTSDSDIEGEIKQTLPNAKVEDLGKEDGNFVYKVTVSSPMTEQQQKTMVEQFGAELE